MYRPRGGGVVTRLSTRLSTRLLREAKPRVLIRRAAATVARPDLSQLTAVTAHEHHE